MVPSPTGDADSETSITTPTTTPDPTNSQNQQTRHYTTTSHVDYFQSQRLWEEAIASCLLEIKNIKVM